MIEESKTFKFESGEKSDVGLVRAINEDRLLSNKESCVWLVADGMGGHAAGDFASQAIVSQMETLGVPVSFEDLKGRFIERLYRANQKILMHASELGRGTIGSTIVALLVHQDSFACIWSGDSRLYLLRNGTLRRISKDHTEVQALLDQKVITPEAAETWERRNVITNAIGVTEIPVFELREGEVADGDRFLMCSDGLTEYLTDPEIESLLMQSGVPLQDLCDYAVNTAVERGGKDNISVVITDCHKASASEFQVVGQFPEFGGFL